MNEKWFSNLFQIFDATAIEDLRGGTHVDMEVEYQSK